VKISYKADDRLFVFCIFDPHYFVVAGIVILWEVNVVFPEEVIGNHATGGMENDSEILQPKRLGERNVDARKKTPSKVLLCSRRLSRRVQFQCGSVFPASFVETPLQMEVDPALMVSEGSVV
jgi:hypothetical protein